jgi:hypothetical protein
MSVMDIFRKSVSPYPPAQNTPWLAHLRHRLRENFGRDPCIRLEQTRKTTKTTYQDSGYRTKHLTCVTAKSPRSVSQTTIMIVLDSKLSQQCLRSFVLSRVVV